MWFLAILFTPANAPASRAMANSSYPTMTACMATAAKRVRTLERVGVHGYYLCAYQGEPFTELAGAVKRPF